ncbi:hypothetical protein C3496_16425 [Bacillus anthracis]|uniref:hypothetical protein n=1 Tax=Bacillus TaxID=1386 RepID=UPI0010A63CF1|nr:MULTISPECIES: hypothetical protein [Bacillus]MDA2668602.1 hypothetical protein [Bacillus cereus]MCX9098813.1 hypothetical protein [Bacillus anthracis]QBJ67864.1 hypothetical protein C3496_16425 [Bacillus anthracis]THG60466.1 hypothetical protein E7Y01_11830 [Bacillus sp. HUB-I-004]WIG23955.1 hypothetical protein QPL80_11240 [Bacillus anthracis]
MSTIENLKEMERLATVLMKTAESPETKYHIGMLLQLFGKEAEKFGKLNQALSDELAELEALREFIKMQGLQANFESYKKLESR